MSCKKSNDVYKIDETQFLPKAAMKCALQLLLLQLENKFPRPRAGGQTTYHAVSKYFQILCDMILDI